MDTGHSDDAYAAMLLTMALSPDKEEYVRPLSIQEFRRVETAVRGSRFRSIGALLNLDISGLRIYLGISEEDGYRLYTLMHRDVQLSYALEAFQTQGIEVVSQYDPGYPQRLGDKLREAAPTFFYRVGDVSFADRPASAGVGISGVKTTPEVRCSIEALTEYAAAHGYAVITGGERGVARMAANAALDKNVSLVEIVGGGMREHLKSDTTLKTAPRGSAAVLSLVHPDAPFTVSHGIQRNKLLFALADAAFVFNTDGHRGELDALAGRVCDWIYALDSYEGNMPLIARGARPFGTLNVAGISQMSRHWSSSRARQITLEDML